MRDLAGRTAGPWRIATLNIRHGRGLAGRVDLAGIRRVLERADPHWAGLQVVDGDRRPRSRAGAVAARSQEERSFSGRKI